MINGVDEYTVIKKHLLMKKLRQMINQLRKDGEFEDGLSLTKDV